MILLFSNINNIKYIYFSHFITFILILLTFPKKTKKKNQRNSCVFYAHLMLFVCYLGQAFCVNDLFLFFFIFVLIVDVVLHVMAFSWHTESIYIYILYNSGQNHKIILIQFGKRNLTHSQNVALFMEIFHVLTYHLIFHQFCVIYSIFSVIKFYPVLRDFFFI